MNLICLYIIVPLSLAALVTGQIQSLGTRWGLFRHYWVLVKFLLTILCITVLLFHQLTAVAKAAKLVSGNAAGTLPRAELGGVGFVLVRASWPRHTGPTRGHDAVGVQTMGPDPLRAPAIPTPEITADITGNALVRS